MRRSTFFDRNKHLQIHGDVNVYSSGGSVERVVDVAQVSRRAQATKAQSQKVKQGFKILCDNTAPSARYGYGHSFMGPQCHPGTRVAVQEHIFKWFNDENGEIAMWMHGPVGIGKSAIAQTVAHLAAEREELSSAFFFFRSDEARNTAEHLVATLAYEMIRQIPHTRDRVCETIGSDPLIFSSPLEHQIEFTLLRPTRTSESFPRRRLIVIDGLDECLDIPMQQVIIQSFISTFLSMATDTIPHKILIASRPESHIASVFSAADICPYVKCLALDSWDMGDDIQSFLRAKLDAIQQTHPLKNYLPYVWPDDDSFRRLLYRSLGSFAYASVAIRYLSSHNNNPERALRDLLSIQSKQVAAVFSDLDAVYRHILDSLDSELRFVLQKVLCLRLYCSSPCQRRTKSTIRSLAVALSEDCSDIELVLIRVSSLIKIDESGAIKFHHTSVEEFLWDKTRSGDLYPFSPNVVSIVVAALSNLWLHPISDPRDYCWFSHLAANFDCAGPGPRMAMTCEILNTLVETKLPTSFLYPSIVGTPAQMPDPEDSGRYDVLDFCLKISYKSGLLESTCVALLSQALDVVCAWLRSHLDIIFKDVPTAMDLIGFLLEDHCNTSGGVSYQSPSFYVFRHLVRIGSTSIASSCIWRVFPDVEYTDVCHGIIDRYIALPHDVRTSDIDHYDLVDIPDKVIPLTALYLKVLCCDKPTIPSVCQRLEQIVPALQTALGGIGSQLTSKDYILGFFLGDRCYIDSNGEVLVKNWHPYIPIREGVSKIVEETDLYIHRAHAEHDFPYISADVEAICKIQSRPESPSSVNSDFSMFT